jgi:type I restriction-modification system DNA methylase subunit
MDRIKQLEDIINNKKYLKTDLKIKSHGEVQTPHQLVEEMIETIPEEVWSNPDLKWLDPCAGTGVFTAVVALKLMNTLKDVIIDQEERYQHIMNKMIYACELQEENVELYKNLFK